MGRDKKDGLVYFPLVTNFFSDTKIKVLKARYGSDGVMVYIYLLCEIYTQGYYIKYDDDFKFVMCDDLNMSCDKTEQIINFLCKRSLLNATLFTSDKVLTSHGIQAQYQESMKARNVKRDVWVEKKYWLLDENKTLAFIKYTQNENNSRRKADFSRRKADNFRRNATKEKESKEKKIKEKESNINTADDALSDIYNFYQDNIGILSPVIAQKIADWLGDVDKSLIMYAIEKAACSNVKNWNYINSIINNLYLEGKRCKADIEERKDNNAGNRNDSKGPSTDNRKYGTYL